LHPRVSVVIPAYNRQKYLPFSVESVLGQTYPHWELTIVDDGSTDATPAIAQEYARKYPGIRVVSQPNGGVAAARNRGFAESDPNTEFVIFLDSDDIWEPYALETLVEALDSHPEALAAHGIACSIDKDGRQPEGDNLPEALRNRRGLKDNHVVDWPLHEPTTLEVLALRNCIVTPGLCLIRRCAVQKVGPFDTRLRTCQDWDFMMRLSRHGPILFIDRVLLRWRRHEESVSHTLHNSRYHFIARRKLVTSPENTPEQRQLALRCFRMACRGVLVSTRKLLSKGEYRLAMQSFRRAIFGYTQYWLSLLSK
jgi:glycosyltransferase involved in cell wall biosynthesis